MVLRKKPAGPILRGAHAVDREFRVLNALSGTDVPVPRAIIFHDEPDVVGTPFYLMERLEGRVFHDASLPGLQAEERRQIYFALADTLARATVSNAFCTYGSASLCGVGSWAIARTSISLVPPPAGIRPTPTSTRPI